MLKVTGRNEGGKTLAIERCVQIETYRIFEDSVDLLLRGGEKNIILDLSRLEQINPMTVERIIRLEERLSGDGRSLQLAGCNRWVRDVLEALMVDRFIRINI